MKPLRFDRLMTNKEKEVHIKNSKLADNEIESVLKNRKTRIDNIMYDREIEGINKLYGQL